MNKKTIITALLALVSMAASAQQVMLADSITKNPVSYATVYDANGIAMNPRVSFIMMIASFSYLRHFIQYQKSVLRQRKRSTIIVKCTSGASNMSIHA